MRPRKRAEIDWRKRRSRDEIDHGQTARDPVPGVVIGDVRQLAVGGRDHFVGIGTGGSCAQHVQRRGIDDRQRVVTLVDDEQQVGRHDGSRDKQPCCEGEQESCTESHRREASR